MEDSLIQIIFRWSANIMLIICMYCTIFWFLFSQDFDRMKNNFFNLLLRLEFIATLILFLSGLALLILEPVWLDYGYVIINVILTFLAITVVSLSNYKTRNYINNMIEIRSIINVLRVFSILFLMTAYTFGSMIFSRAKYGSEIKNNIEYLQKNEN